ncbi:carbohydrate binding domain-containing protein [Haloplasma contractile]|uniref:Chitinase ChiA protein n=1 Tax=Haloplasma contractile SSD-17B TaxID=1033810 RepID=U2DZK1_9MOLU|nr:carbohydrate binding domain-containing protein [Haloplasma contractile]ERJ13627.1 Chitinase ChiA protein [Haloplasma contractile SSD-17B]
MKKLMALLGVLTVVMVLAACTEETTEDTSAPELTGIEDVTFYVGQEEFDILDGVTATDDIDGDITNNIETIGIVKSDIPGLYTVRYKIEDEAGNLTQESRIVEVKRGSGVVNGKFTHDTTGWRTHIHSVYEASDGSSGTFTVENEEGKFVIDALGANNWSIQLFQEKFEFAKGDFYELSFKVKADEARTIEVVVEDPENGYHKYLDTQEVTVTSEWQTFTYDVVIDVDTETGKLGFLLGASGSDPKATTLYFDDVVLKPVEAEDDTEAPEITFEDLVLEKDATFDPLAGVTITDNQDFDLTVADIVVGGDTVDTATPGTYTVTYKATDASGNESAEFSRTITVEALIFVDTGAIVNGDFEAAIDTDNPEWGTFVDTEAWSGAAAAGTGAITNGEYVFDITAVGGAGWAVQLQQQGITLEKGQTYKLVFDAKAETARTIGAEFGYDPGSGFVSYSGLGEFAVTETMDTYEFMFTVANDTYDNIQLAFVLGKINDAAAGDVTIDNVQFLALDEEPVLDNGNFEALGFITWYGNADYAGYADASFDIINEEMVIDVKEVGNQGWGIQFNASDLTLENGNTYKLTFDVKSETPRYFQVKVKDDSVDGDWQVFDVNTTSTYATEEVIFTYAGSTTDSEIHLEFGYYEDENGTETSANGKVYLDNIKLEVQDDTDNTVYTDTAQITNGTFDQAVDWTSWWGDQYSGVAGGTATVENGELVLDITALGDAAYAAQVFQEPFTIKGSRSYVLEFDIKADVARSINVQLGEGLDADPWFNAFMDASQVDVTTDWETITITFDMTQDTNENGKLVFEVGKILAEDGTELSATGKIYIDNVIIYPVLG